jgi:NAD(P)-dependent dehydrogenase (short-subunit alcohol dehydrogenase family)
MLVSGGAAGIGRATAELFAGQGYEVLIADIDPRGEAVAASLGGTFLSLDVSQPQAWDAGLEATLGAGGSLDLLFLNAGAHSVPVGDRLGDEPLALMTAAGLARVEAVNVHGTVHGIIAARPYLERAHGDIVVTASLAGLKPLAQDPLYAMAKHAVIGLVRSLAEPLAAHQVRIQAICPGAVDTALPPDELRPPPGLSADPSYQAGVVRHALAVGEPGDVWVGIREGEEPWRFEFPRVRRGG